MKGPAKTLKTIGKPISDLLRRGYNGAFLVIDVSHTKYFLQLRKYISAPGEYGIELFFPNAKWSINFFNKLIDLCENEKIRYSLTKKNDNEQLEFLCIDFAKNSHDAYSFIKRILLEVFEVNEDTKLFIRLENATTEDVLIDK
jgi:hypothetical protein